ncbi:uncharacterized protein [Nicotiana sylvestris]|uniref:uncharacterized protein n=1 Tax=Nicotiana sylvestris TaxID=4096 RepID=UPI00388CD2F7
MQGEKSVYVRVRRVKGNIYMLRVFTAFYASSHRGPGYILSALEDDLYDVNSATKTSKELWDTLEKKYKTEDACFKKLVVAKFLDYKTIDSKTNGTQVQELQLIFHDLITERMVVNEAFQVSAMTKKLPPSWRDFKNYLKHKRKEMKLGDLVIHINIEEENKTTEIKSRGNSMIMGVNIVKETAPKSKKRKSSSGQTKEQNKKKLPPSSGMVVNEAFQVAAMTEKLPPSWRYFKNYLKHKSKEMKLGDLVIHIKIEEDNKTTETKSRGNSMFMGVNIVKETAPKTPDYLPKKDKKKGHANIVEKNDDIDHLCAMLSEYNLVGNPKEWWIDYGATRHVCAVKETFATYSTAGPEEELFMGNTATTKIEGYGKIFLKVTSGKELMLNNVLHVPIIRKNLVSTSLLVKNGFKCVFVSDKVIVSKNEMYVRNGYLTEGLFKLNEEPKKNTPVEEDPRRSKCQRTSTFFGLDFVTFLLENEPQTFRATMPSSDSTFWKETINSEIQSILNNHTWELVDFPQGNKPLGSKWIFKRKMKVDGTIDKYKARLVVKGYRQKKGLDYFDTYSPITRITSIRLLVALATVYDLKIHQMDVKIAFLNGELEE